MLGGHLPGLAVRLDAYPSGITALTLAIMSGGDSERGTYPRTWNRDEVYVRAPDTHYAIHTGS